MHYRADSLRLIFQQSLQSNYESNHQQGSKNIVEECYKALRRIEKKFDLMGIDEKSADNKCASFEWRLCQ